MNPRLPFSVLPLVLLALLLASLGACTTEEKHYHDCALESDGDTDSEDDGETSDDDLYGGAYPESAAACNDYCDRYIDCNEDTPFDGDWSEERAKEVCSETCLSSLVGGLGLTVEDLSCMSFDDCKAFNWCRAYGPSVPYPGQELEDCLLYCDLLEQCDQGNAQPCQDNCAYYLSIGSHYIDESVLACVSHDDDCDAFLHCAYGW